MKHTKGNWKEVGAFVISENNAVDICSTCSVNYLPLEEQIANARLIAAAPNLLKACEDSLVVLKEILSQYMKYDVDGSRVKIPLEKRLEAAIAKAKS